MENKSEYSMIIVTTDSKESAKKIAGLLVERRLAACVQLLPIESVYVWEGKVCDSEEILLLIKSKAALFDELARAVKENHEYEVPEIIQLPIVSGLPEYLKWIDDCTCR